MALPFLGSGPKRREQIIGVDLGSSSAKAVHLQRKGSGLTLIGFSVVETGATAGKGGENGGLSQEECLSKVLSALGAKGKQVAITVGAAESILRSAELPLVPVSDMRTMLKFNSKNYLQQDLSECAFDCFILPPRAGGGDMPKAGQKARVLVGAAKNQLVEKYLGYARSASVQAEALVPEHICCPNAFELAEPEVFAKEALALVDLGFLHSSVNLLLDGELVLSRVVGVGGDHLTTGLAEALGTSYGEAEGIKVGLAHEVQGTIGPIISPLARELRASIDFFEHQHDRTVGKVHVSGAAAKSDFLLEALQTELMVPCAPWNPMASITPAVKPQQLESLEQSAGQLCTAVGAALSVL